MFLPNSHSSRNGDTAVSAQPRHCERSEAISPQKAGLKILILQRAGLQILRNGGDVKKQTNYLKTN
jgi:hypothetical protein